MFYTDASAAGVNLVATALSSIENLYVQNVAGTAAVSPVIAVSEVQSVTLSGASTSTSTSFLGVATTVQANDSAAVTAGLIAANKSAILNGATAKSLGITDISVVGSTAELRITFGGPNGTGDVAALSASATSNGVTFTAGTEITTGKLAVTAVSAVTPTQTIDATTLTDTGQFWNNVSTNAVTFSNIQQAATIGVKGVTAGANATTTANFDAAVTKGTADSVSVVFDGSTDAGTVTIGAGFETVNVTAIGENKVAALTTAAKTVNITGAGDLEITASLVGAKVIDGSTAKGDLTIGAAATGADLTSVKTGSGDDTVTIAEANFRTASELAIALGAGDDTLVVGGNLATAAAIGALKFKGDALTISGVEVLSLGGAVTVSDVATLNLDGLTVDSLVFEGNVSSDDTDHSITLSKFSGNSISFEGTVIGATANTHKVLLVAADVTGALSITTEAQATDFGLITLANATSLSINAEAAFTSAGITAAKITTLTVDTDDTGAVGLGTVTGAALTTITATGDAAFGATIAATTTKVTSVDLSGLEGTATIGAGSSVFAGTVTVKIGEGGVSYTANASTGASREIFQFVGEEIGAVTLTGFSISSAATGDKLDFSQFANVSSLEDLVVVLVNPQSGDDFIRITAKDVTTGPDAFSGTIEIKAGADLTSADITDLVANSFIF